MTGRLRAHDCDRAPRRAFAWLGLQTIAALGLLPIAVSGLLAIAALGLGCARREPVRNVVLILLDTVRVDRLSCYGNPEKTSPTLDALAEQGVRFETVVSNAPWTLPAMVGLFAGDFPTGEVYGDELRRSLVERIHDEGILTAAFVEGGFLSADFGFALGFDEFRNGALGYFQIGGKPKGAHSVAIDETFGAAEAWLREHHDERFFLVIHTYEPHTPYERRDFTAGLDSGAIGDTFEIGDSALVRKGRLPFGDVERRYVRALYDGGLLESDRHVARLLATLQELGIRDQTAMVVTSDHGEDIGGRKPEWPGVHGHNLYDELLLVPLIIQDPTRHYPVQQVTAQVRTVDTFPTILDLLGVPSPPGGHGRSLLPLMEGRETDDRFAWSHAPRAPYFGFDERYAIRTGGHKLILSPLAHGNTAKVELYDLRSDPAERANLAARDRDERDDLLSRLAEFQKGLEKHGTVHYRLRKKTADRQVEERLRELGYLE